MEKEMKIEGQAKACEGTTCGCSDNKANYDQLANVANQLYVQNQELSKRLNELEMDGFFKRLDWLWSIINSNTAYITEAFKQECGKEFMAMMTKPEDEPHGEPAPVEE